MSLSEIAIRKPVFAWMLMAAIILFGCISFSRLGISQLPDVDFPMVGVSLSLPGAAPEVMESQVVDPVEDAIMEIDGIRNVTSTCMQTGAQISIEFDLSRDIDQAMQEVQNKINQVRNLLPVGLFPPTLRKYNPEDSPILWIAVTADDPKVKPMDMMIYARNVLYDQFATLDGVGNVALGGYVDPALRIWADINKIEKYNFTSDDLIQSIYDGHLETPSGILGDGKLESNVRLMGEASSPQEFGLLSINSRAHQGPNYKRVQLKDVAEIEEGLTDVRKIARYNSMRTVGLGILKQHGSNAVEVADRVRKKLEAIKPTIPKGWHVDLRSDNTRFIKQNVHELLFTLGLSALLTSFVCYLFLGSLSSTLNVLMAIPTSIIGTFTAFLFLHFTLNTFTLLGLSLAIGIVVDDAIMMLENIVRHQEMGQSRKEAAINGANEISFAALAATVAVVAIFIPVIFMDGVIGRYFFQYGITVTAAVLLSLLEALTLTPMRCSRYLTIDHNPRGLARAVNRFFAWLSEHYERWLTVMLDHRWKVVLVAALLFMSTRWIAKMIPSEMMPAQDQSMFLLRFKLPVGTSLQVTDSKISQVEKFMLKQPEIDGLYSFVGGFGGDAVNQGMAYCTLVDPSKRKLTQAQLVAKYRKQLKMMIPGMEIVVQDLSLRGFAASRGFPVEFVIQGPIWEKLTSVTNEIMDKMKKSKMVVDVNTDIQANMPEVHITPDRAKLAAHAVSLTTVTNVINALVGGAILNGKTMYPKDGHRYEIELRLSANERQSIKDLKRVKFRNNRGEVISLPEIADIEVKPNLMMISRLNRMRAITVYANPAPGVSQKEAMDWTEKTARAMLPGGYEIKMSGSSKSFSDSMKSLIFALLLGILVSYMVLASQFNSFIHPVTVLMALPFGLFGAFLGLLICHQTINIYSLIGFILLFGIVKKNSILLVDFTNQTRAQGLDPRAALLKACPVRLRPILMTSVAVIAGAMPEALSIGPGAETTIPMAISIIGGVAASTVVTLFLVPCVYSLFTSLERPDTLDALEPVQV